MRVRVVITVSAFHDDRDFMMLMDPTAVVDRFMAEYDLDLKLTGVKRLADGCPHLLEFTAWVDTPEGGL